MEDTRGEAVATKPEPRERAPEQTNKEVRYLRHLIENDIPVCVRLISGEEVRGVIEFYDVNFVRLTRMNGPNLFIFKHDIKYLYEIG
jgi:RNA chaperone Hfq